MIPLVTRTHGTIWVWPYQISTIHLVRHKTRVVFNPSALPYIYSGRSTRAVGSVAVLQSPDVVVAMMAAQGNPPQVEQ